MLRDQISTERVHKSLEFKANLIAIIVILMASIIPAGLGAFAVWTDGLTRMTLAFSAIFSGMVIILTCIIYGLNFVSRLVVDDVVDELKYRKRV